MAWKALLSLWDTNDNLQTQLSDLSLSPLTISILKINTFLHLNMFIDYPFKTKISIVCESWTVDSQAHSSRGSNKRRYYSKIFLASFCGALERTSYNVYEAPKKRDLFYH